jgi:hypothetical protein
MNKPNFGNYNNSLWEKLFKNVECDQITKYYSDWTSNIDINKECIYFQKKNIHVDTFIDDIEATDLTVNKNGMIVISDCENSLIRIFNKNGIQVEEFDGMVNGIKFNKPSGIAIRYNNIVEEIIVVDTANHRICSIKDGIVSIIAGSIVGTAGYKDGNTNIALFDNPTGIAIKSDGTIIISDTGNHCIRTINANGDVKTIAGSIEQISGTTDDQGIKARFNGPCGIAIQNDNIIIADSDNRCVRSIDIDNNVITIAGSIEGYIDGNGTNAYFACPYGICIMKDQTIIITDIFNNCIRSINPNYDVETIVGNKLAGFKNGLGTIAKFNVPMGITIDASDNIFVADNFNKKIRRLYYK